MSHLSDEAVAAFADDVLDRSARERARKHCAECAECTYAVAVQREAIWALRAAPAPALSSDLLSRLRDVPSTTPIRTVPTSVADDGTVMFASFGTAAAFVPTESPRRGRHRLPFVATSAVVALAAAVTAGSVAANSSPAPRPAQQISDLRPALLSAHIEAVPATRDR